MNKLVAFILLFFSTIATAKYPMTLQEMAEHLKHHPATVEREKAVNDLKRAAIASGACIAGGFLFRLVMKDYEFAKSEFMSQKVGDLPIAVWTAIVWAVAEIGGLSYVAVKGAQGAKHLLFPDHKFDAPETHVRVKREDA